MGRQEIVSMVRPLIDDLEIYTINRCFWFINIKVLCKSKSFYFTCIYNCNFMHPNDLLSSRILVCHDTQNYRRTLLDKRKTSVTDSSRGDTSLRPTTYTGVTVFCRKFDYGRVVWRITRYIELIWVFGDHREQCMKGKHTSF